MGRHSAFCFIGAMRASDWDEKNLQIRKPDHEEVLPKNLMKLLKTHCLPKNPNTQP